jgi:hypothetical protein
MLSKKAYKEVRQMRCLNHHLPSTLTEGCEFCGGDIHLCGNEGVVALYHCVNCREVFRIRVDCIPARTRDDRPSMGQENLRVDETTDG